jgi:hypothetical protein
MGKKAAGHYRLCRGFSYAEAPFHLFIFSSSNGEMAIQRSSCHLLSWIHTIRMSFAGMDGIVLRTIE